MTSELLILRPEPGASTTAKRAQEAGWKPITLPLFMVTPQAWDPPADDQFDAVMMTSANAAHYGGAGLSELFGLPLYAVGAATAEAAKKAGFARVITGPGTAAALADQMRANGVTRIFHPAGAATRPFDETDLRITRATVYDAKRVPPPDLAGILRAGTIILVHSPRAATYLDMLCTDQAIDRSALRLVAISQAALDQAGQGWGVAIAAEHPDEAAMLAAASTLGESDPIG